ncbi:SRPBCC family protein [Flavobacterium psychrotolerans]|uniref:Polyketide cyclase n=1 Tax=Flavobacterium psychrotolerans TaxID=2169410 RepID=A0A2U1JQ83_9FLAO|nr:SRPBCC family protein [Flavobacterium psychrotolerans]PWA07340.1 polyketide cyclase [Flavobacterium psychrotolerans]
MKTKESITVETLVKASIEKIWRFWTSPEHIKKWNNASEDWHTTRSENDLRIGGKFLFRMEAKDGSFGFDFEGIYDVIITNEKISYTLLDDRKVTVLFVQIENGVKIIEIFDAEEENTPELQKQGWQAILNNFKTYVEKSMK